MNGLLGNAAMYMQRGANARSGLLPIGPASFQGGGGGRTIGAPSGVQVLPSKYAGLGEGLAALGQGISGAVDTYKAQQEADKQKAQWQALFTPAQMEGGPTAENAKTAPIYRMGFNDAQIDLLQRIGPEKGMPYVQQKMMAEPKLQQFDPAKDLYSGTTLIKKGVTPTDSVVVNGKLVDKQTGRLIGDYSEAEETFGPIVKGSDIGLTGKAGDMAFQKGSKSGLYKNISGSSGVSIENISVPSGYMIGTTPTGERGVIPIPGGPEALKLEEAAKKEANRKEQAATGAGDMLNKIDRASAYLAQNPDAAGLWGSVKLKLIPGGTTAHNLKALIDPIKASLGFQELQTMRENSPTGGALGGIAVAELDMLQATISSLDQIQDAEQLQEALQIIRDKYEKVQRIISGGMTEDEARAELEAAGSEGGGVTDMQQSSPLRITVDKGQNAMPTGSVYIGKTSDGKPVFQSPNGKRYVGD